jgi:uncharacterized repeat protein (TIGR01451 family)
MITLYANRKELIPMSRLLLLTMLFFSSNIFAADISLTMRAEKEIPINIQGSIVPILKPIHKVNVGDTIVITLNYKNNEAQEAYNVNIDNPIPVGTRFVSGSGFGKGAVVFVSYDNGDSYEEDIRVHNKPLTNIRWQFENMPANAEGEVGFHLKIDQPDHQLLR